MERLQPIIDPHYPAMGKAFEGVTGLPYPAGLTVITDLLFPEVPDAEQR